MQRKAPNGKLTTAATIIGRRASLFPALCLHPLCGHPGTTNRVKRFLLFFLIHLCFQNKQTASKGYSRSYRPWYRQSIICAPLSVYTSVSKCLVSCGCLSFPSSFSLLTLSSFVFTSILSLSLFCALPWLPFHC
jgi:hypothetical protein